MKNYVSIFSLILIILISVSDANAEAKKMKYILAPDEVKDITIISDEPKMISWGFTKAADL